MIAVNHNPDYADADGILEKNPFRYRGYYLDEETGWYYLNSRYYDPEVKRFINSDRAFESILTNACVNLNQYNLFAYCNDNPVNKTDEGGNLENWQKVAIGIGVIAAVGIVSVATAGTATPAVACFAAGAFEGAITGAASGAAIGAATGAIGSRITTGSWDGAGLAAMDGAADGFMTGAIAGAITGGITSNHCFVAGTLVVTDDGYKPIEEIEAGDSVFSADEITGERGIKKVVQTFVNETDELIHVQISGEEILTTPSHPFFIYGKGFDYAKNLRAGDILVDVNGEKVILEQVQHELLENGITVYNFEVEDYHTYFVGDDGVWVHNVCTNASKVTEGGTKTGGAYKDVPANGGQVHHMPADSVSPYSKNAGPGIRMETLDHMDTASWGNSKLAQEYRAMQKELIDKGLFREAQQMDIDDVRALFGNKYDDAIQQMLKYTDELLKK